jgi:polyhydroxyalkanoate synthesis regulator protein
MHTLIKYKNRKIYSYSLKSYVNFSDIKEMILRGEEFKIQDHKGRQDVTAHVLVGRLLNHQTLLAEKMSLNLLKEMIVKYL